MNWTTVIYAVLWFEGVAIAILLAALWTARSAQSPTRWRRVLMSTIGLCGTPIGTVLLLLIALIGGGERPEAIMTRLPRLSVWILSWMLALTLVMLILGWHGLRPRRGASRPGPLATNWSQVKLLGGVFCGVVLACATLWLQDQLVLRDLAAVRARASETALAIAPSPLPDDQNAAPLYREAARHLLAHELEIPRGQTMDDAMAIRDRAEDLPPLRPEEFKILDLLHAAAEMSGCRYDLDYASLDHASLPIGEAHFECFVHILVMDAAFKARAGDGKGCWKSLRAVRSLAEHTWRHPTPMSIALCSQLEQAYSLFTELLVSVHPELANAEALSSIDPEFTYLESAPTMIRWVEADLTALAADITTGGLYANPWHSYTLQRRIGSELAGDLNLYAPALHRVAFLPDALAPFRETMAECRTLAGEPHWKVRVRVEGLRKAARENRAVGILGRDTCRECPILIEWASLAETERLVADVGLAIATFSRERGWPPDELADLVPTFTERLPVDPFTGKVFRLRRLERGLVVYSIGPDQRDDQGKPYNRTGPIPTLQGDVPFRVLYPQSLPDAA